MSLKKKIKSAGGAGEIKDQDDIEESFESVGQGYQVLDHVLEFRPQRQPPILPAPRSVNLQKFILS